MASLTPTVLFCSIVSIALSAFSIADEVRTVVLAGQPVPGTTDGTVIRGFDPPTLNNAGQTAFSAGLTNGTSGSVFSEGSGVLQLVAREGTQAPGAPAESNFVSLTNFPILNDGGSVAFGAGLRTPSPSLSSGIWKEESGILSAEILTGTPAPGTVNEFGLLINGIVLLNSAGDIASKFTLTGNGANSSNDIGIWATNSGTLGLVARDGDQVPGEAAGVHFDSLGEPVLNDVGQLVFTIGLVGPSVDDSNNSAILFGTPGSVEIKVREGDVAPGTASSTFFTGFGKPKINALGDIVFSAALAGGEVDANNERSIWSESNGVFELLAQAGSPAPEVSDNVNFLSFGAPEINDAGQVAFEARLTGSDVNVLNEESIWLKTVGVPELVIRGGGQAPGTPAGAEFGSFGPLVLNSRGQLAFTANLFIPRQLGRDGPFVGNPEGGVNSSNNSGLWATDLSGALRLIAREGDVLQIGPNDFRTVASLGFTGSTGNGDGLASGFNDRGEIAFAASFSDGSSGIFVSDSVSVLLGDVNQDELVNFLDIPPFISILSDGGFLEEADINRDEAVNFLDIFPFVALLSGQ